MASGKRQVADVAAVCLVASLFCFVVYLLLVNAAYACFSFFSLYSTFFFVFLKENVLFALDFHGSCQSPVAQRPPLDELIE